MSKFKTTLPTNINEFLDELPKRSHVHSITINPATKEIDIAWENDRYETGLTVAVDFPESSVKAHKPPKGVRDTNKPVFKVPEPVKEVEKKTDVIVPPPQYMTEREVAEARFAGKELEFMGMETVWKPVDKEHTFTNGFFYRLLDNKNNRT